MELFESQIRSFDGVSLYTRVHRNPFSRGIVVFVHGFGEHCGRYEHVAEHLMVHGFSFISYDLRGHGRSPGPKGLMQQHESFVADLSAIMAYAESEIPGSPLFLMGHGFGAGLVMLRSTLTGLPRLFGGSILSAPMLSPGKNIFATGLMSLMASFWPRIPLVQDAVAKVLSRDPNVGRDLRVDPLNLKSSLPLKSIKEWGRGGERVRRVLPLLAVPSLILQGTGDLIAAPRQSEKIYELMAAKDKTLLTYSGYYHDLLHEYGKEAVLRDLTDWLLPRAAQLH